MIRYLFYALQIKVIEQDLDVVLYIILAKFFINRIGTSLMFLGLPLTAVSIAVDCDNKGYQ